LEEERRKEKHKARFQVVGADGVAESLQRGTGTVGGETNELEGIALLFL
jgi:hypothetical protein